MRGLRQAFVGAGANLGDRVATLRAAADALRISPHTGVFETSALYESEPVGVVDQPRFLNAVFELETDLTPELLLEELHRIEHAHGRVRDRRWGPRTLDLDLLHFAGETRSTSELTLPHPRLFDRAFVVVPVRELLSRPPICARTSAEFREAVQSAILDERGVAMLTNAFE